MTTKIIFNIIESEIDHNKELESFTGWNDGGALDYKNNPYAYLEYEKHAASPAIDWCHENGISDFVVKEAPFAMRIAFIFKNIEDAMAFKLYWLEGIK